jgi:hypothetical protein
MSKNLVILVLSAVDLAVVKVAVSALVGMTGSANYQLPSQT